MDELELEYQLAKTRPSILVSSAAILIGLTGLMALLTGLQFFGFVRFAGWLKVIPYILMGIFIVSIYFAKQLYRMRSWAAYAGLSFSGLVFLSGGALFIFALLGGFFSLALPLMVLFALAAAILSGLTMSAIGDAVKSRSYLASNGLDVDF